MNYDELFDHTSLRDIFKMRDALKALIDYGFDLHEELQIVNDTITRRSEGGM